MLARMQRSALGAALALVALALGLTAPCAGASPATATPTLSFLRAGPTGGPGAVPQIVDEQGRSVLLKGVNVDGIVDYFRDDLRQPYTNDPASYQNGACPANDPSVEGVVLCDYDFPQMRSLGYDAIRLNLSWSLLEPQPGEIDQTYLDRIAQVVAWAKAQGTYVVLDMHQDAWSKYVYTRPGETCTSPFQTIRGFD